MIHRTLAAALSHAALALVALVSVACSGSTEQSSPAIVAADSAGLRLLTIPGDPRGLPALRVGDSITLHGVEEDYFNGNPQFAFPLNDGRVLLSDGRVIAVFGADGGFTGQFSRPGQGPGEIANLSKLWQVGGDSIWTFDGSNRRLSLFAPTLEYVRSQQQPSGGFGGRGYSVWAGLRGDTTAVLEYVFDGPAPSSGTSTRTSTVRLGAWVIGDAAPVIGEQRNFGEFQMLGGIEGEGVMMMSTPMGGNAQWQPLGRCMVYGYSDQWDFTVQAPDDSLRLRDVARLRSPGDPADAVTPERREQFITGMLQAFPAGASRTQFEKVYREQLSYPDSTPHFSRVFASRDGALWVQRYRGPTTDVADHWTVVDLHTPRAWRLDVPPGSRLLAVDVGRALIATKDGDDVETQQWWTLPELAGIQPPPGCGSAR